MVFVKSKQPTDKSYNVAATLHSTTPRKGVIGLEIEVEGNKFPMPEGAHGTHQPTQMPGMNYWSYVHDGSLRGDANAEYLLTKPVEFDEIPAALEQLFTKLKKYGSVLDESNRTSVHVHLNIQPFFLNRLTSLMALYYVFEEVLTEWCGDTRVGNLFCLRAVDAPAIISQARRFIGTNMQSRLNDNHHYAGLNTHAIHKLGSLEFRTLRGVSEPGIIQDWVGILRRLYEISDTYPDPRNICGAFSQSGPLDFFDNILGDTAPVVMAGVSLTQENIRDAMYRGIRLAQDLCYARDWSVFNPTEYKPDPFKRGKGMKSGAGLSPLQFAASPSFSAEEFLNTWAEQPTQANPFITPTQEMPIQEAGDQND